LEELLPKDNENIPLFDPGPLAPAEPIGFRPEQLVACNQCDRTNPPTRVSCLYCGAALPANENTASLQRPTLRPLESWEQGYSNILLPGVSVLPSAKYEQAAQLLKLDHQLLERMLASNTPLPVALAATPEEASLVKSSLDELGIRTLIISDAELELERSAPVRVRSLKFDGDSIVANPSGGGVAVHLLWSDLTLIVQGRLIVTTTEVKEQTQAHKESEIVEASETYADEAMIDVYSQGSNSGVRIAANNFDFSCLQQKKTLLATENFSRLVKFIGEHAPTATFDDSYKSVRQLLEQVWTSERQTESSGWRRERFGRYTVGSKTELNNQRQFTRYSRLRNYLHTNRQLYEI
jgi:hypothetical protein